MARAGDIDRRCRAGCGIALKGPYAALDPAIDPVPSRMNVSRRHPNRNRYGALAPEHPLDTIDHAIEDCAVVGALINHDVSPSAVGDGALRASPCKTITLLDRLWFHFCVRSTGIDPLGTLPHPARSGSV